MNEIIKATDKKKMKQIIMLYLNQILYNDNQITEEMYSKAKDVILRNIA